MLEKNRAIHMASFGGWLNFPDYCFYWGYHGQNALFEEDREAYEDHVKQFIRIANDEVPRIPLYEQIPVVGMQKNIQGYTYWFHRQLDFRQLEKS
jgi:peptide/nickel transport system substrate-binding protein